MTDRQPKRRRRQINPDRIVLSSQSLDVLLKLQGQIHDAFSGVIHLSTKELTNFVLQARSEPLSKKEIEAIRLEHFDDVKAALWAVERLKTAKLEGASLSLSEVLKFLQTPHVNEKVRPERTKVLRKEKVQVAVPDKEEVPALAPERLP